MKIQEFVDPLVNSIKDMDIPPNSEGIEAQLAAFIPLMKELGCREAAAMLQQFVGVPDKDRPRLDDANIFSPDMPLFCNLFRGYHPDAFAKAQALSITAWSDLRGRLRDARDDARLSAIIFLCKCVQACQAVLLLAEHGLELEAAAVLREASEYLFVGCGMARAPQLREQLIRETERELKKQADLIIKGEQNTPTLDSVKLEQLQAFAEGKIKGAGMSVFDAAKLASMDGMYHGIYRTMSRIGTHATAATVLHSVVRRDRIHVGPDHRQLELILTWVIDCLTLALEHGRQWRTNEALLEAIARGDGQITLWARLCELHQQASGFRALLTGDEAQIVMSAMDHWVPSARTVLVALEEGRPLTAMDVATAVSAGDGVVARLSQLLATMAKDPEEITTGQAEGPSKEVTDPAIAVSRLLRRSTALLSQLQDIAAEAGISKQL